MKDFETWYKELTSDTMWFELLRHYKDETIKKAGQKVFAQLVADKTVEYRPMSENRKHVYNILCKNPGDKVIKKEWIEKALKKIEPEKKEEWKPASPEHVDKCANQILEMIKNSPMVNGMPRVGYKQAIEEGGWLPKKEAPYPQTSKEEAYVRQRHLEYIKRNYEPRTAQPLPNWIPEHEFNLLYDNEML